eukprot:gnl/MRDRNA2_/MRDRNA2_57797_c0_seq2.p1 gnl/MRDRNA2_/MRDRNA2_57797_c0~~gnl/MRDRNA2_/MRDRNA2_57797_c0_seq2.p1  ORF type:complete len:247 (+),score=24.82 gnl/MRDRNA2_/MRDRNA2_57797_c0_seq2:162-902(+)
MLDQGSMGPVHGCLLIRSGKRSSSRSTDCCAVVPVTGKGLGVVATRDIARGELIVSETPLIVRRRGDAISSCGPAWKQFYALSLGQRAVVCSLHDAHVYANHDGDLGGNKSLEGILNSNCYARGGDTDQGLLSEIISRFNHSCVPNCEHSFDEDFFQGQVYACSAIPVGSELCTTYVDVIDTRADRIDQLKDMYGFQCECPACNSEDWETSDLRRHRARSIDVLISTEGTEDCKYGLELIEELLSI